MVNRLVFWSVYILDRFLAIWFGKSVVIKDQEISIELPLEEDLRSINPNLLPVTLTFPHLVQLLCLFGRIVEVVNGSTNEDGDFVDHLDSIEEIEHTINSAYGSLPGDMVFNQMT